jgi:hypothetical protein
VWLDGLQRSARLLVEHYCGEAAEPPTVRQLDDTLAAWATEDVETRVHANDVVNALGAALGAQLCLRFGFRWILVSDQAGTELAVHGDPGDVLLFPINATAKRVARQEHRFFEAFVAEITDAIDRIRRG